MRPMRCAMAMLMLCAVPVWAQDAADKPVLVLDAGGHTSIVWKVLWTPDGKEVISVSLDKTIRFWDAGTGEPLRVLRPSIGKGNEGRLYAAALSPDGKTLAVAGHGKGLAVNILLLDLASARIVRTLTGHTDNIFDLAFSPDGKRLASGSGDNTARIWEVASGECLRTLEGHTKAVRSVAFAPDGKRIATASYDGMARVWDTATGKQLATFDEHGKEVRCLAWSPDGKTLASGGNDERVRSWRPDGSALASSESLGKHVLSISFTPDGGELLATTGEGGTGPLLALMLSVDGLKERTRFAKHTNTVLRGMVSPDGAFAVTAGGNDAELFIWRVKDAEMVSPMCGKGKGCRVAAWSNDSTAIAWGHDARGTAVNVGRRLERTFGLADLAFGPAPEATARRAVTQRGSVSLHERDRTSVEVRRGNDTKLTLSLSDEYDRVNGFTLLEGDRAAVGSSFALTLFDTRTGQRLRQFAGHTGSVWSVAPSPDNKLLLSASKDQTIRIWHPDRDEPLLSFFPAGDEWIAWTPEGYYACSPGGERLMGWHVNNGPDKLASFYPADKFRKTFYRPDVIQRLLRTHSVERALEEADAERGKKTEPTDISKVLPPTVTITSPKPGSRLDRATLTVEATANSTGKHPVTGLRLLIDGRPHLHEKQAVRIVDTPALGEVRMSWPVTLSPGRHRLAVQADSAVSNALSAEVEVIVVGGKAEEVELPRLYVLAIGVAAYDDESLKLNYAAKDAEAVADAFRVHGKPLFKSIETRVLTDGKATRGEVLKGLTWLRQQVTQRDFAVVFFSGHGDRDSDGALYLLPVDADPADLLSTCLPSEQFTRSLVALPGKVTLMLDACHSGGIDGGKRKGTKSLTDDLVRDLTTDESGLVVMCSSTGREFSLENNEQRRGNFTVALVEGLTGKAKTGADGAVYLHHLDGYVTDRVKELTNGKQHPVTSKAATIRSFPLTKP